MLIKIVVMLNSASACLDSCNVFGLPHSVPMGSFVHSTFCFPITLRTGMCVMLQEYPKRFSGGEETAVYSRTAVCYAP